MTSRAYAALDTKDCVVYIGTEQDYHTSETGMVWVEVDMNNPPKIGYKYSFASRTFSRVKKPLSTEKQTLQKRVNEIYDSKINLILSTYPENEVKTFPFQLVGVNEFNNNNRVGAGIAFMTALAAGRGDPLDKVIDATSRRIVEFVTIVGYITGVRQRYEKQIELVKDHEQLYQMEEIVEKWAIAPLGM